MNLIVALFQGTSREHQGYDKVRCHKSVRRYQRIFPGAPRVEMWQILCPERPQRTALW